MGLLTRWLGFRGVGPERCLLMLGLAGRLRVAEATSGVAAKILRAHDGVAAPGRFGRQWDRSRFRQPYLRNALWDAGYAVDTVETAVDWSRAPELAAALTQALAAGLEAENERVTRSPIPRLHVGLEPVHDITCSASRPTRRTFRRWMAKTAASRVIVDRGGTISHQRRRAGPRAVPRGRRATRDCRPARRRRFTGGRDGPDVLLGGGQ